MTVICVPVPIIPFFRQFFSEMQQRHRWQTRIDWLNAYQVFAELEEELMSSCMQQLIASNNQIYRLLDTALNGSVYTATTDPDTHITDITPDQPVVPDATTVGVAPGLRRQLLDMQGIINAGWFDIGGQPATLADVVNSLRVGSTGQKQNIIDTIRSILSTGASAASILSLIESLFADTVDGLGEGAILATLIATSLANVGMLDSLSTQISRLISSLDGGSIPAPGDNVLLALRGITEASETRNVIDTLSGISDNTADVVSSLSTIETNTGRLESIQTNTGRLESIQTNTGFLKAIKNNTSTITDDNVLLLAMLTNVRDLLI